VGTLCGSGSDWLYGKPIAFGRIEIKTGLTRSLMIMTNTPTTQLLWRMKEEKVERHVTFDRTGFALSQRKHEVTMLAADASSRPVDLCSDLELGAHVARMRSIARLPDPTPCVQWALLSTPRALPAAWETA
jgi:hypothetical protein